MAPEAQLHNDNPLTPEHASPLPSNAAMDATPLHALPSNDADSISAEEQSFVEGALTFLLERPNGELLLERIGSSFLEGWHGGAGADRIRTAPEKIDGRSPPFARRKGA